MVGGRFANALLAARRHEDRRVHPTLCQRLLRRSWPDLERQGEYVFPGVNRGDISYASVFPKAWRRIVGAAYSPHGLRHAYASAAHELGFGELTIKALLGHARLGVTSGYIATMDNLVLAAAEKVAHYVAGAMSGETGKLLRLARTKAREREHA